MKDTELAPAVHAIASVVTADPFSGATWIVLAILSFFIWLFSKASKSKDSPVRWEHLIIDSNNDRASPYKVGYLLGLILGTWVIVALMDKDKLTFDLFGAYLTYLLGGAGVNSFVKKDVSDLTYTDGNATESIQPPVPPCHDRAPRLPDVD